MKRLPQAKRNQLLGVIAATTVLIALVYFFLIQPQNNQIKSLAGDINGKRAELQKIKDTVKQASLTHTNLEEINRQLAHEEEDVARGDIYAWTYDLIRRFKTTYQVDIPSIGQPVTNAVEVLPNFPYSQAKISLTGTAYFHDLGKFVADFENTYPHIRLVNLSMDPVGTAGGGSTEKLNFHMELVVLVKPNS